MTGQSPRIQEHLKRDLDSVPEEQAFKLSWTLNAGAAELIVQTI